MKLEVWQRAVELYNLVHEIIYNENKIDFKIRSQIDDAAQSVPANISEGCSRRPVNEYLQHLYVAAGSLSDSYANNCTQDDITDFR